MELTVGQTIGSILFSGKFYSQHLRENCLLFIKHLIYRFINELSRLVSIRFVGVVNVGAGTTIDGVWVRR